MALSAYKERAVNHLVKKDKICTVHQMRCSKIAMEFKGKGGEWNILVWYNKNDPKI